MYLSSFPPAHSDFYYPLASYHLFLTKEGLPSSLGSSDSASTETGKASSPSSFSLSTLSFGLYSCRGEADIFILNQRFILAVICMRTSEKYRLSKPNLVVAAGRYNSSHCTVQTSCQYLVWIERILNVLSESPVKMIPF